MPALQYVNIAESDFSLGIDARSAENQINPGFVRDLLNGDVVERRVRKRPGAQGYAGNIPVRVTSFQYMSATHQLCLTLDSSVVLSDATVDLSGLRSSPLVIFGKSSSISSGGPFTTAGETVRYYPGFAVPIRESLVSSSTPQTLVVPESTHGIAATELFAALATSTNPSNRSWSTAIPNTLSVSESTFDISVGYTQTTGTAIPAFVYYSNQTPIPGQSFEGTLSHAGGGPQTYVITAGTHGLVDTNIVPALQRDDGTSRSFVVPDDLSISPSGTVSVTINSVASGTFYLLLAAAPVTQTVSGSIAAGSSASIPLPGLASPWLFPAVYLQTSNAGDLSLVEPDSISYDDTTATATISLTNGRSTPANFTIFYLFGEIRSNQLCVTDSSITSNDTDDTPELTIWGLDHTEIYGANPPLRAGWASHVDAYRAPGEQRLTTSLGGNLFAAETYGEAASSYDYAQLWPRLQARAASNTILAPLFWGTGNTPARTRGYITATGVGSGFGTATSVVFNTVTGWTDVLISLPSKQISDASGNPTTLSAVISTTAGLSDWLTLEGMSYGVHEGTFPIQAVADGVGQVVLSVLIPDNAADWNDTGLAGRAGVFTDQMNWTTTAPFIPGDVVGNPVFSNLQLLPTVLSSSGTISVVSDIVSLTPLGGGLLSTGSRTSAVVPLREPQPSGVASVANLVRGDMLSFTTIPRLLRVLTVNSDTDRTVAITGNGSVATVTQGSGDTSFLRVGMQVLLLNAGSYTGVQTVSALVSDSQWTFSSTTSGTAVSGTLAGNTMQVDEELSWSDRSNDGVFFQVDRRWIPVEAPLGSGNLLPTTHVRYWDADDYGNQSTIRSTGIQTNLYATNYDDEVLKYDGQHLYRAGLIPWQPGLLLTQDTDPTAKIVIQPLSADYTAIVAGSGTLTLTNVGDSGAIPIGTQVLLTGSAEFYTVTAYSTDAAASTAYLQVDRALDGDVATSGTAAQVASFRYYFRLNAVDANGNLLASAVSGSEDHVVVLTASAAVQIKLANFPSWDAYDYDTLELQIYRTKQGTAAPFYSVATLPVTPVDNAAGYITYTDTFADSNLGALDSIVTALKGSELGTAWQEPYRAKYTTSIGNTLVLANIRDYPQLDIQVLADASISTATYAGAIWTFLRDSADLARTTNNTDRVRFEFLSAPTGNVGSFTFPNPDQFVFTTAGLPGSVGTGSWIYLSYATVGTAARDLTFSGWWQVVSVSGNAITVSMPGAAAAPSIPDQYTVATDPRDVPVLIGTDGNLGMVNGETFATFDVMRRLSSAIQAVMRLTDISLTGQESFVPWLTARGGNDTGKAGRVIVRQPRVDSVTPAVVLPSTFTGPDGTYQVFVGDISRVPGAEVSAVVRVYPSRLLFSYENFPEIFDNPTAQLDTQSDSAIDVNSADGQEITGVIPFFGEAAFTAAQQTSVLVVFKTNSIYLVDITQKRLGNLAVQRLQTEGLGCTAPYSISVTKHGIVFANDSGIYCLRPSQSIDYLGRFMERNWLGTVNLDQLALCQGHHYGPGRLYKLSVPLGTDTKNSAVFAYNHTAEDMQILSSNSVSLGAWSRYDSHPATGWANLAPDAFYCTSTGRVMSLRRTGELTDFRDDNTAISFSVTTRGLDLGNAGIRKVVDRMVAKYRSGGRSTHTSLSFSVDLSQQFESTSPIVIPVPGAPTDLDDVPAQDIYPIASNVFRRRGVYFSVLVANDGIDEGVELAGLDIRTAGLSTKGILQAEQTESM